MPPKKKSRTQLDREIAEVLSRSHRSSKKKPSATRAARKGSKSAHATAKRGKSNGKQAEILMVANDAALERQFDRAEEVLAQSKPRAIATAYQIVTEASSRIGDVADRGWEDKEGEAIEVAAYDFEEALDDGSHAPVTDAIVKKTAEWLRDHGASDVSSSPHQPGDWYSTEFEASYETGEPGEERSEDFFLRNFTPLEEKLVFDAFRRGR
jgi:hypothetical protein